LIERLKEKRTALISRTVTRGLPAEAAAKAGLAVNPPLKPSGLDWLGDIPTHWFRTSLKRVVSVCGRIGFRGYTTDDLVDEGDGALAFGGTNLTELGRLDLSKRTYLSWLKYEESPEIKVTVNDLVIGQRGTCGNVVIVDRDIGPATINPSLVLLKQPKIHGGFLCYSG
jgi:type I restriction enzyme S subunit